MLAIYVVARIKKLPAEPWRGFGEIVDAGKEAGWGLFLIFIIMGGIYGGAFTPTEAASVAAVYAGMVSLFVYRDMGPLKGIAWIPEGASRHAIIGFKASVYALALFLLWSILSFFFFAEASFLVRFWIGLGISVAMLLLYPIIKRESNPLSFFAGLSIWGRNLGLIALKFFPALFHKDTKGVLFESARTTIMLMFIIVNAFLFAHVLTSERIPQLITEWMLGAGFNWFTFLIAVNILLLIGGQFMEPSGLLLIVAPVVFPIAMELGVDPIHLGIIMVVNMEIGMITPPIGLNLFVTSGITGMSLMRVVKAALPFVAVLMVFLVIVTYVPQLSIWLPYSVMGPEIIIGR
jgi:C4-dicarboxylate transporter DctM subunit